MVIRKKVKHPEIIPYESWDDIKEDMKDNRELGRLVKLVESGDCYDVIDTLQNHKNTKSAKITLTTAHKSKGLEYDQVVLANDFPSNYNKEGEYVGLSEEERNLLYVASTRAIKKLEYNKTVEECLEIYNTKQDSKSVNNEPRAYMTNFVLKQMLKQEFNESYY